MGFCVIKNSEDKFLGSEIDSVYYSTLTGFDSSFEPVWEPVKDLIGDNHWYRLMIFENDESANDYIVSRNFKDIEVLGINEAYNFVNKEDKDDVW